MKMKAFIYTFFHFTLLFSAISCKTNVSQKYSDVYVGEHTMHKLETIGVELDPHFFSQNLTRNDGSKESKILTINNGAALGKF